MDRDSPGSARPHSGAIALPEENSEENILAWRSIVSANSNPAMQMKNAKNGCRDINCATKIIICQHKQRTANRTIIPTGKLQNRQLPYKESKKKNVAEPPLATKQTDRDTFRLHRKPGCCAVL